MPPLFYLLFLLTSYLSSDNELAIGDERTKMKRRWEQEASGRQKLHYQLQAQIQVSLIPLTFTTSENIYNSIHHKYTGGMLEQSIMGCSSLCIGVLCDLRVAIVHCWYLCPHFNKIGLWSLLFLNANHKIFTSSSYNTIQISSFIVRRICHPESIP